MTVSVVKLRGYKRGNNTVGIYKHSNGIIKGLKGLVEEFEQLGVNIESGINTTTEGSDVAFNWGTVLSYNTNGTRVAIVTQYGWTTEPGTVKVYDWNGSAWVQAGSNIVGENDEDYFGASASLSGDGTRLIVGANANDGNGSSSGHARVYEWNNSDWVQKGSDIDGEAAGDNSGISVSISSDGSRVAIGATGNDGGGTNVGHVRVFDWNGSAWTQVGSDIDGTGTNDTLGWSLSLSGDGSRLAVSESSVGGSVKVYEYSSSSWSQLGSDLDGRGYSIKLDSDGDRLVIGTPYSDNNGENSGHFAVYEYSGSSWSQLGSDINGENAGDQFGTSVSISDDGSRVAASSGSYFKIYDWNGSAWTQFGVNIVGSGARVSLSGNGARVAVRLKSQSSFSDDAKVAIYRLEASEWQQLGSDIDGEAQADFSGRSVSLSTDGTTVAIGANFNDGTGSNAGHVRVYTYSGSAWTQVGSDIDGEAAFDQSGYSVSLDSDGDRVAIGAIFNDGTGSNAGHVRVYEYSGSAWTQLGSDIDGEEAADQSGRSVSLSDDGSRVAIGANFNDGTGSSAGHVRVFDWNGSAWVQVGSDIDGESAFDQSGIRVSLSSDGTRVAIGAIYNSDAGSSAGHVRVYNYSGSAWVQLGSDIDGAAAGDQSGGFNSVSLDSDGDRLAIGSVGHDGTGSNAGHVRVYTYSGSAWTQVGSDIDGEAAGDQSGYSVSLSSDGTRLVIGAISNDGTGSNAGHVRAFEWNGSAWVQIGSDIDGEAEFDQSGYSISLSGNGTRVAIGAIGNDATGSNAGHVRVYEK